MTAKPNVLPGTTMVEIHVKYKLGRKERWELEHGLKLILGEHEFNIAYYG